MKTLIVIVLPIFFCLNAFGQDNPTSVLIKLKGNVDSRSCFIKKNQTGIPAIDSVSQDFGATSVRKLRTGHNEGKVYLIEFPSTVNMEIVIEKYLATKLLEYAEKNGTGEGGGIKGFAPDDAHYKRQWGLNNDGSFGLSPAKNGADISMEDAWDIEDGDTQLVIAIMDSGVKLDHPDLEGRIWMNYDEIPANSKDDDNNGYIDDVNGWNYISDNNNPKDDLGHGSNIAGIIACKGNNKLGYAGVVKECKIMSLKGLNSSNQGFYSDWAEAIYYAVDNGAQVINLSVGGSSGSQTLEDAVNYALSRKVVLVACMMNTNSSTPYIPASFPGVIAVGSTDPDDTRTAPFFWNTKSGSNYGSHISVIAPGNYIYSIAYNSSTNYESYWGGTSQATPLVVGLAALLKSQDTSRAPAEIKKIIETTAQDKVGDSEDITGWDQYYGWGRVNAKSALQLGADLLKTNSNEENFISVFPNPAINTIYIHSKQPTNYTAKIFSTSGNVVHEAHTEGKIFLPDNLIPGLYVLHLTSNEQSFTTKFFKY